MAAPDLKEWLEHYAKHRHIARGTPFEYKEGPQPFAFTIATSARKEAYVVATELQSLIIPSYDQGTLFIVITQTQQNQIALLERWKDLIVHEKLILIFANPHSVRDKYWLIHPYLHHAVADPDCLKLGLQSMGSMVDVF